MKMKSKTENTDEVKMCNSCRRHFTSEHFFKWHSQIFCTPSRHEQSKHDVDEEKSSGDTFEQDADKEVSGVDVHICLICDGKEKMGDKKLDFDSNFDCLITHYSLCYYKEGAFLKMFPIAKDNLGNDGKVLDEYGKHFQYECVRKEDCGRIRKMGYKELCVHLAVSHSMLEEIMSEDNRDGIEEVLEKIRTIKSQKIPLRCRISGCAEESGFLSSSDLESVKSHYTSRHFKAFFLEVKENGKPRVPVVTNPALGIRCKLCGDRRVIGDTDVVVQHFGVVHDKLEIAIRQSGLPEAGQIIQDLYAKIGS